MWYSNIVHKSFYASGFVYHSPSGQILLQQSTKNETTIFDLFRGKNKNGNNPKTVFQQCVEKALKTTFSASSVHTVYDYVHDTEGEHYVFYIEINKNIPDSGWIQLSKLSKYTMSEQTRHDIIIGERVIRSQT
jgi:hypothetical protein